MKGGGGLCPGNAPWGERQVGNPHKHCHIRRGSAMYLTLVFVMILLLHLTVQVDCGEQYCGLLLEERLTYNK